MKIEMGESLFYSWLRHVKECQIVQTNWKVSLQWTFCHEDEIQEMMRVLDTYFETNHNYKVFKKNVSLAQIIRQGECDVLGMNVQDGKAMYHAVEVAFHEAGLQYGTKEETVMKVIEKCIRIAFCLYGYFGTRSAEIVFASPKIHKAPLEDLLPCIEYLNMFFDERDFEFRFRVICNDEFEAKVLQPILLLSDDVADTSELFMRAYQMYEMFAHDERKVSRQFTKEPKQRRTKVQHGPMPDVDMSVYGEMKIGRIADIVLRNLLECCLLSETELMLLQTNEYSKRQFDIQYPLLVKEGTKYDKVRYYSKPVSINGERYFLCSQWFETEANNDRPYLLKWIEEHR